MKKKENILNDGEPIEMQAVVPKKPRRSKPKQPVELVTASDMYSLPVELSNSIALPEIGYFVTGEQGVVKEPVYSTNNAACFDISAYFVEGQEVVMYNLRNYKKPRKPLMLKQPDGSLKLSLIINPGDRALVPTGLILMIPTGYSVRMHPRSGLSLKHFITLANSEGIIDDDYIDETFAMLVNQSDKQTIIRLGDRICQGELHKNQQAKFKQIKTKPTQKTNRTGGFGSTGV